MRIKIRPISHGYVLDTTTRGPTGEKRTRDALNRLKNRGCAPYSELSVVDSCLDVLLECLCILSVDGDSDGDAVSGDLQNTCLEVRTEQVVLLHGGDLLGLVKREVSDLGGPCVGGTGLESELALDQI